MVPPSPPGRMPSGWVVDGTSLSSVAKDGRSSARGMRVVHEAAASSWPLSAVVVAVLQQRLAHALRDAAVRLAVQDQRIDRAADIVDRGVAHDLDPPVSGSTSTSQTCAP